MPRIWRDLNRDVRLIALTLFAWALGEGLFLSFVTLRLEGLGAAPVEIGNIMALYALVMAVVMIPAGIATDRWGAWRVMFGALLAALVTILVMALADTLWFFAVGWVAYGFTSWIVPAITTYVTNRCGNLPPARALGVTYASYSAGMVLSPLIGGLLSERFGLRMPFMIAIVFILASVVAIGFAQRDIPQQVDIPRRYNTLFRNQRFMLLLVICFVVMLALWMGIPLAPNYLQNHWGIPVSQIGLFGSAEAVGSVVLSLVISRWSPMLALFVLQIGVLAYLATLLSTDHIVWLSLAFFLRVGPVYGRQFIDCIGIKLVPSSQRGLAFSITPTVQRLSNMIAAMTAGWLYEVRPGLPFQTAIVLVVVAMLVTWIGIPKVLAVKDKLVPVAETAEKDFV